MQLGSKVRITGNIFGRTGQSGTVIRMNGGVHRNKYLLVRYHGGENPNRTDPYLPTEVKELLPRAQ